MCELFNRLLNKIPKDNCPEDLFFEEDFEISDRRYISEMNFKIAMCNDSRPDLLLIYAFTSKETDYRIPIVIGELKTEHTLSKERQFFSACKQLLSYQVAVQRPLRESSGTSGSAVRTLFGFVMDQHEAYIIELNADLWNTKPILKVKSIERFSVDSRKVEQSFQFFTILLVRVLKAVPSNDAVWQLTEPLFRFPSGLGTELLDSCILKAKSNKLKLFFDENIENIVLCYPKGVSDIDWGASNTDTELVLKVYGNLCFGGEDGHHLWTLLNNARREHQLRQVTSLYKSHFQFHYFKAFPFSISRFIHGVVCSNKPEIRKRWKQNADTMPKRFFEDVYQVAFEALELLYFHWDIRPANIMFDDEEKCFVIIDWESVVLISPDDVSKKWNLKFEENANYLHNLQLYNENDPKLAAGVYVFYQLMDCLEYIGGPTKTDDWFNEVIVEPLKSIHFNMKTFKQTFDSAMCEALGPFVCKELLPQFNVPEKTSVELYCEFTLPANTKLHDPRVIWRRDGVQIEAEDGIISDVSANDKTRRLQCRLNLFDVLPSHEGTYDCIVQLQETTSSPLLTTTVLRVTTTAETRDAVCNPKAGEKLQSEGAFGEAAGAHSASTVGDSSSSHLYVVLYCSALVRLAGEAF